MSPFEKPGARNQLDLIRTVLANERTFLAYLRSGLALAVTGFSAIHLIEGAIATVFGVVMVCTAFACLAFGTRRVRQVRRAIDEELRGDAPGRT
jgi:putative membrane protein